MAEGDGMGGSEGTGEGIGEGTGESGSEARGGKGDQSEAEKRKKRLLDYLANPEAAGLLGGGVTGSNSKLSDYDTRTGMRTPGTTIYPNLPMEGRFMNESQIFQASPLGKALSEMMAQEGIQGIDMDKIANTTGNYRTGLKSLLQGMGATGIPKASGAGRGFRVSGTPASEDTGKKLGILEYMKQKWGYRR